jgi:DNA-directed RNA polymerase subunit M/transcription elongation factor TFIIS
VSDTLRVSFQVSVPRAGISWSGAIEKDFLNFTGETELSLEDLRKILATIVSGPSVTTSSYAFEDFEEDAPVSKQRAVEAALQTKPRKSPRRKTKLICVSCGRSFKGMGVNQKYCHKADCRDVELRNIVDGVTARALKNYPAKRVSPTPRTSAVCQHCGRSYMAYTKLQKRCGKADCRAYAAASRTLQQQWRPQATLVAGQGVISGSCLT